MPTVDDLLIRLDATTESLRREMRRAEQSVNRFERGTGNSLLRVDRHFAALGATLTRSVLPALAGLASVRGIQQMVADTAQLADTADKLGVTAEQLQELRFAAEQVGVSSATFDLAFQRFTRRLGEANTGTGELLGTLQRYNIALRDTDGRQRSALEVLGDLANATANAGDAQNELLIAFKAFDSEGAALVNLLRQGAIGIDEFRAEARRLGLVLENDLVESARETDREFKNLTDTITTKLKRAVLELVSGATDLNAALDERKYRSVASALDVVGQAIERAERGLAAAPAEERGILQRQLDDLIRRRLRLQAELEEIEKRIASRDRETPKAPVIDIRKAPAVERKAATLQLAEFIRALEEEAQVLRANAGEQEQLRAVIRATNAARKDGIALTDEDADRVHELTQEIEQLKKRGDDAKDISRELGLSFSSAFEDAIVSGNSLRDVVQGLLQDLLRLAVRKTVTEPIFRAVSTSLEGAFGGGGTLTASANGNVMTGRGPAPLRRYASGGIARSPQLALFGEGSTPEAYVPLPDGRSIPVTLRGGGGGGNVEVNVINQAGGAQTQVRQRRGAGGARMVDVVITDRVREAIGRGSFDGVLNESFGLRRTGVSR